MIITIVLTLLSALANCGSAQPTTAPLDLHHNTHSSRDSHLDGWHTITLDQFKDGGGIGNDEPTKMGKSWNCEKRDDPSEATSINSCMDAVNGMFAHFDSDTFTVPGWTCIYHTNDVCMTTICNADTEEKSYSVRETTDLFVYPLLQECVAADGSWGHYQDYPKSYVLTKYGNYYGLGP